MIRTLLLSLLICNCVYAQVNQHFQKPASLTCNNWLRLPSYQSYVTVGDLDIPGNQITVEAVFNRTAPYSNGYNWAGDLVSKHVDPSDANYLLRPNNAEITTTNGFFTTPPICEIELNKTYHAAFVYDGVSLKFYRNGYLMSSVPATGNLIQNNHDTRIGLYDALVHNTNFIGFINEVRIWNVAKTQAQIRSFMDNSLPNPTTQPGLLAYYTFDNLLNKQGNSNWNGALGGTASINGANPLCSLILDSCNTQPPLLELIVNSYTPINSILVCTNKIIVEDGSLFNVGDTVVLMQMKGATIDSSNTAAFGDITQLNNSGKYEFNYIKGKSGNTLELKNKLLNVYNVPNGKAQLIRVPYFSSFTLADKLTCLPWDGSKGGVVILNVENDLTIDGSIDVSAKGFLGGLPLSKTTVHCNRTNYYYPPDNNDGAQKGESFAEISINKRYGRGAIASGGGGGNSHNSGGAGGGNGGRGGSGGNQYPLASCPTIIPVVGGVNGRSINYSNADNRVFLGGGGGAGHANDGTDKPGGNGGGILIVRANRIIGNNKFILANGGNVIECTGQTADCANDGHSGGGAGGTILISANQIQGSLNIEAKGGKGADAWILPGSVFSTGPGGGGGGGIVWHSGVSLTGSPVVTTSGGLNGIARQLSNDPWGAGAGSSGITLNNLQIPVSSQAFKPNIDSVRFTDEPTSCTKFNFNGLGYTNTSPITSWQWTFGDGGFANTQNTSHTYTASGTFNVKLVVTDNNGCKDSISRDVTAFELQVDAGPADTLCAPNSTVLQASSIGTGQFSWQPAAFVNDPTLLNPVATPPVTTTFYLTATNALGCESIDSVKIEVRAASNFFVQQTDAICLKDTTQLFAGGGDLYSWLPASSLDDPLSPNPRAFPLTSTIYQVTITDTVCGNSTVLPVTLDILPLPEINASRSNNIDCTTDQSQLMATGGSTYLWTPAITLNNPGLPNPIAKPSVTTQYAVTGTDADGCSNTDTITVVVEKSNKPNYLMPTAFTPNGDGKNDCFRPKYWGVIEEIEFSVWNRWGQRIFYSRDPNACWDGTFEGTRQPSGVFVFIIRAKTGCDPEVLRKGTFALIR